MHYNLAFPMKLLKKVFTEISLSLVISGLSVWLGLEGLAFPQDIITMEVTPNPIDIQAGGISTWQKEGARVFEASGDVRISQGKVMISANDAICWFYEQEAGQQTEAKMDVHCMGKVVLIQDRKKERYEELYVRLETTAGVVVNPYVGGGIGTLEEEPPGGLYPRTKKIRELGKGEFAVKKPLKDIEVISPPGEPEVVDIVADDLDSWIEGDTRIVVALGDVDIRRAKTTMKADNAILWFDQIEEAGKKRQVYKELYAQGNVTLITEKDVTTADKIFQNFKENKAIYINPRLKTPMPDMPPMVAYVKGKEMKQLTSEEYLLKNGTFTTCSFGHPHYHVRGTAVTITQRTYTPKKKQEKERYWEAVSRHNVFYVGKMPLAFLPVYKYSTREKEHLMRALSVGSSSRFGRFVRTDWNPYALGVFGPEPEIGKWSNLAIEADYLSLRGPAGGVDFEYDLEDLGMEGLFDTYFISDKKATDQNPTNEKIEHKNRGRVLWRHRDQLTEYWRMDAELSLLSDRGFMREFFEREFKEGKAQETDLYFRRLKDNQGTTFLLKRQIHDFDTGLETLPQINYRLISQPLWEDRLNFTSQSEMSYLDFKIDDEMGVRSPKTFKKLKRTTGDSFRVDTDNTLSLPFQFWVMKVSPFVGSRVTGYSKSLEDTGPNDGPPEGRLIGSLGLDSSTSFWRIYSLESKLLRIHKLRHVITPEFRWVVAPVVTKDPDDLLQYDSRDAIDNFHSAIIRLRNRMQTRRGPPWKMSTVDLLDLGLELHLQGPTKETPRGFVTHNVGNAEGFLVPERDSFLQFDLRSQVTDRITLASERNEYNINELQLDVFNLGMSFQRSPTWGHFVGYRFLKDTSTAMTIGTNILIGDKWNLNFGETFAFKTKAAKGDSTSRNLASSFSFSRDAHDWTSGFSLNFDVANRNTSFSFFVQPKGIKRGTSRGYSF